MKIRSVCEVWRSRVRELEEKVLRVVLNAQVVVHGSEIAVEAAGEGAHRQVDTVGQRACSVVDGNGGRVERESVSLLRQ